MIALRVVMSDPSKLTGGDAFGIVGAQFKLSNYKIEFKLAKQFWRGEYSTVAKYLKDIHDTIKPNFMGLETNNIGKDVLKLFHQKYKLNFIHGVSSSANLTAKTRSMGYAMDKPFMVKWFKKRLDTGMMEFPAVPTKDMQELIDQIPKIVEMKTRGGQTTYQAYRGQHDDVFDAALHCCNFIRLFIEQQERLK